LSAVTVAAGVGDGEAVEFEDWRPIQKSSGEPADRLRLAGPAEKPQHNQARRSGRPARLALSRFPYPNIFE